MKFPIEIDGVDTATFRDKIATEEVCRSFQSKYFHQL